MADHRDSVIRKAGFSPLLLVLGAAVLWSTGGLFIKATSLSAVELSFGRSLLAAITKLLFTLPEASSGWQSVAVSYPRFADDLGTLTGGNGS